MKNEARLHLRPLNGGYALVRIPGWVKRIGYAPEVPDSGQPVLGVD